MRLCHQTGQTGTSLAAEKVTEISDRGPRSLLEEVDFNVVGVCLSEG